MTTYAAGLPKSRPREVELDILLAHEFASGSPAAAHVWSILNRQPPQVVDVARQVERMSDRRTSDVVVIDDATSERFHCENKLANGSEVPGQFEGLVNEVRDNPAVIAALVIAPRAFFSKTPLPLPLIAVEVERLADELKAATAGVSPELGRSYRYRCERLRALCETPRAQLSELGVVFRNAYNDVLTDCSGGAVQLLTGTLTNGGTFAGFRDDHPCPSGFAMSHKLHEGLLDVRVPGWGSIALLAAIETQRPASALPEGWSVAVPRGARVDRKTGEKAPALRHVVPTVPHGIWDADQEAAVEVVRAAGASAAEGVAETAAVIGKWFEEGGTELLRRPTSETLEATVMAASRLATQIGRDDVRDALDRLADGLR